MTNTRKHKDGDWHHRAPDWQLVYCGPKKRIQIKEEKNFHEKRMIINSPKTNKNIKKIEQNEKTLQ